MRRHAETNNLMLYTVLVKLRRSIAAVAVKDKQVVDTSYIRRSLSIKVLQLEQTKLVSYLAVIAYYKRLVIRQAAIPASLVLLS